MRRVLEPCKRVHGAKSASGVLKHAQGFPFGRGVGALPVPAAPVPSWWKRPARLGPGVRSAGRLARTPGRYDCQDAPGAWPERRRVSPGPPLFLEEQGHGREKRVTTEASP